MNKSSVIYAIFVVIAYSLIAFYVYMGLIPAMGVIALVPIVLSLYSLWGAIKYSTKIGDYPRYLGTNVAAAILTPLLLGMAMPGG